jgi:hypothetical protein
LRTNSTVSLGGAVRLAGPDPTHLARRDRSSLPNDLDVVVLLLRAQLDFFNQASQQSLAIAVGRSRGGPDRFQIGAQYLEFAELFVAQ